MLHEELRNCLDEQGRVKVWPKKHARKDAVIQYLAEKFEHDRVYTEKEVNSILDEWHTFNDYFLLRRSLIEANLLSRGAYGREYRRVRSCDSIKLLLENDYGLTVNAVEKSSLGAGSDTFFAKTSSGRIVVKFPTVSEINHPEEEVKLCAYLIQQGIPACRFLNNAKGQALSYDEKGHLYHVQEHLDGTCYALNTSAEPLVLEMARMLGRIHHALRSYPTLPEGIGASFFRFMTPQNALASYQNSLQIAQSRNADAEIIEDLQYRINLVQNMDVLSFDPSLLTYGNTHGDYFISQLLCKEEHICAVIDWTTACVHPLVWEIIRSFVYGAQSCVDGQIDSSALVRYVSAYKEISSLSQYDLQYMLPLFFYQLSVCDYYGQYFSSTASNRKIFLHQAKFSTKILRCLEESMDSITQELLKLV